MKKGIILSLLVAGGAATYYLLKKLELKVSENEDITFVKIEEDEEEEEDQYSSDVNEISGLYPYLSKKFIDKVYAQSDKLDEDYPNDTLVEIKHYASFGVDSDVKGFVTIMEDNSYDAS